MFVLLLFLFFAFSLLSNKINGVSLNLLRHRLQGADPTPRPRYGGHGEHFNIVVFSGSILFPLFKCIVHYCIMNV